MGLGRSPPAYPTLVRHTPLTSPNRASGVQNQPFANVAVSRCSGTASSMAGTGRRCTGSPSGCRKRSMVSAPPGARTSAPRLTYASGAPPSAPLTERISSDRAGRAHRGYTARWCPWPCRCRHPRPLSGCSRRPVSGPRDSAGAVPRCSRRPPGGRL